MLYSNHHDASKHNFASLKNDLIAYAWSFQKDNFNGTVSIITIYFFICHPLQEIFINYKSRPVVDEDYNGKFRVETVKDLIFSVHVQRTYCKRTRFLCSKFS